MNALTDNKRTVEEYMAAFRAGDRSRVLACLTDDVEWVIPGGFSISGKTAFEGHIQDPGFTGTPDIVVTRMVEEHDVVAAEGQVRTGRTDGTFLSLRFCDVFVLTAGKIRHLTSYLMEVK